MANFMGLACSPELARETWELLQTDDLHGNFNSYGFSQDLIVWMNATMAALLPEKMLARYGLMPTLL